MQLQQAGKAAPLAELDGDSWDRREQRDGALETYARSWAAYRYLVERYGEEALTRLLRQSGDGSNAFADGLTQLTGLDESALGDAVSGWLLAQPRSP